MKIIIFYHFDSDPGFPPSFLNVRWKSGVIFVRRCFRDVYKLYEKGDVHVMLIFLIITITRPYLILRFSAVK